MVSALDFLNGTVPMPDAGSLNGMSAYDYLNQPAQMQGAAREVALPASSFAKGFGKAMGMAGDLQALGDKFISDPLLRLIGRDPNQTPSSILDPQPATSQEWLNMGKQLGLTDRPDLTPQTPGERNEAAAFEGAGAAAPFAPFAGIGGVLPTLAAGAGSGVGGHLGGIAGQKLGYPRTGELLGSIAGALPAQGIASGLIKAANAAMGNYSALGQAYKDAGVPLNFTPDAKAAAYSSQSLGGSGRTLSLAKQEVDAFGRSVESTASYLGSSQTAQEAGTVLQNESRNWLTNVFPQKQQAVWAPVDAAMGFPAAVAPDNYRVAAADLASKLAGLPATKSVLLSDRARALLNAINTDVPQGAAMSWQEAQNLRSVIGEIRGVPEIANSLGDATLGRLYGALTSDMEVTAARRGVIDQFRAANAESTRLYSFRNNVLSKILGSSNPAQETIPAAQAANTVLNSGQGGDFLLGRLRQEMPNATDELAAYKLRDMGAANAGQQNAAGNAVSPFSFLTDWNRLSPEARSALYSDPHVANKIDALAQISEGVKERLGLINTSKTAHHGALTSMALAAAEGAKTGYEAKGIPGAIGGAAMGASVIPGFNYAYSLLGANRPLARLLAAQGPNAGIAPYLGGAAANPGLLAPPEPRQGLLQ